MATGEMISEKIYLEDSKVKVTNVRITCQHVTIPVEKINSVSLTFKAEGFFLGLAFLAFSFCPFFFFPLITSKQLELAIGGISLVLILFSSTFTYLVYRNYVQLIVSVVGRDVILIAASMGKRKYMEGICDKIANALMDEKKYQKLKEAGTVESSLALNPSETIKIKLMLEDYEKLRAMKEEFTVKKDDAKK